MELNPLERESLWQDLSSNNMMQHDNQSGDLQITLQEVINMIDGGVKRIEEDLRGIKRIEKDLGGVGRIEENSEGVDDLQWADWLM